MHLPHALLYLNFAFSCYFIISLVLAPCISHRRYMLISLWLLCAASLCHLMHTLLQERYSSVAPQGSLPAFEIAFQTFCLGLWQDTSLLLTAITALVQPAGTPLNEAKSLSDIQRFSFLLRSLYHFAASLLSLTLWPGQVSEEQRGRRQSGRAALSVSSGPTISQLTCNAQINCTLLNSPTFPPFKKDCLYVGQSVLVFYRYMNSQHKV